MIVAPRCKKCRKMYVEGRGGLCWACVQARRKGSTKRRHHPIRCDCGCEPVIVTLVQVGTPESGFTTVRLPLCQDCLELEKEILGM
jgi:hypothetical protein